MRFVVCGRGEGGFLRLRWWLLVVVVVVVFSGVLGSVGVGGGRFFDLPSELEGLVVDAVEVCGGDEPWHGGCVEAVWAACLWAERNMLEAGSYLEELESEEELEEDVAFEQSARYLSYAFLCRVVHMAELARLAEVLVDRYGSEFYEGVDFDDEGVWDEASFWWFREHMTYTPWSPVVIYGSFVDDVRSLEDPVPVIIGPVLAGGGWSFTVGRWLKEIRDWGIVGSDKRLSFSRLSDRFVGVVNSLLGSIASLTEVYDSWPVDAPYDSDYGIKYDPATGKAMRPIMYDATLVAHGYQLPGFPDSGESESSLRVYEICSSAIVAAKIRTVGWEDELDECQRASQICFAISGDSDILCDRIALQAQIEKDWQKLPTVCQPAENENSGEDECELAMREMCRFKRSYLEFRGTLVVKRYMSMRVSACETTQGPSSIYG